MAKYEVTVKYSIDVDEALMEDIIKQLGGTLMTNKQALDFYWETDEANLRFQKGVAEAQTEVNFPYFSEFFGFPDDITTALTTEHVVDAKNA